MLKSSGVEPWPKFKHHSANAVAVSSPSVLRWSIFVAEQNPNFSWPKRPVIVFRTVGKNHHFCWPKCPIVQVPCSARARAFPAPALIDIFPEIVSPLAAGPGSSDSVAATALN